MPQAFLCCFSPETPLPRLVTSFTSCDEQQTSYLSNANGNE